jgi:hypothetical protein
VDYCSQDQFDACCCNLYIALSRSSAIRLLHDFDENLFKQTHDLVLFAEDDRLVELDGITKWGPLTK